MSQSGKIRSKFPDPNRGRFACLNCGAVMTQRQCKVRCIKCGYFEDCSDGGNDPTNFFIPGEPAESSQ